MIQINYSLLAEYAAANSLDYNRLSKLVRDATAIQPEFDVRVEHQGQDSMTLVLTPKKDWTSMPLGDIWRRIGGNPAVTPTRENVEKTLDAIGRLSDFFTRSTL